MDGFVKMKFWLDVGLLNLNCVQISIWLNNRTTVVVKWKFAWLEIWSSGGAPELEYEIVFVWKILFWGKREEPYIVG